MAYCDDLNSGIDAFCGFNLGGIVSAYIADYDKVDSITLTQSTIIDNITMASGSYFYEFNFREDTSTFVQTNTPTNNSDLVEQVGTLVFQKVETLKNNVFNLLRGKKLIVIYEDSNGQLWFSGHALGARIQSITLDFGTDRNDPNISTVAIIAREPYYAYEVDQVSTIPVSA